jgi:hypothetical protein
LYCHQPFHCPTSVEHLGLDCKVKYTNANQGIMPEADNIWVQYTQSEEIDLNNTFQGRIPSFPVLYFSWTPPNHILQFQARMQAGKALTTFSTWRQKTQQCVLHPQAHKYLVVITTKCQDFHGWADCVNRFIQVFKQTNKMHILPVKVLVGLAHLVR